jgi:hypothetical protein
LPKLTDILMANSRKADRTSRIPFTGYGPALDKQFRELAIEAISGVENPARAGFYREDRLNHRKSDHDLTNREFPGSGIPKIRIRG